MNYIERIVDRGLSRYAWKSMGVKRQISYNKTAQKITKYRWIIKRDKEVIYDTEANGYEGLNAYPVIYEALEMIEEAEKTKVKQRKKDIAKREVIFQIDSQLLSIFPNEKMETKVLSNA